MKAKLSPTEQYKENRRFLIELAADIIRTKGNDRQAIADLRFIYENREK